MTRFRRRAMVGFAAGAIIVVGMAALLGGSHRYPFTEEPRLQEIAMLSPENPQVALAALLEKSWDYVCFVPPYYPVAENPKLAGLEIPWVVDDSRLTVVLKRGTEHDLYAVNRGDVVEFRLDGLPEGEACFDSTDVVVEYAGGDGPITLRVTPRN